MEHPHGLGPSRRHLLGVTGQIICRDLELDHLVLSLDLAGKKCAVIIVEILQLFLVFLRLWIAYRQYFHEVVGRIGEFGHGAVDQVEVLDGSFSITLVNDEAVRHQNKSVEVEERLRTGRVNG